MPARLTALALSLSLAACAAVPPPPADAPAPLSPPLAAAAPPPQRGELVTGQAGRELARGLLASLADQVVEVRRNWSGPGYFLHGFELWERPTASSHTNLCTVRVHRLNLTNLTPEARHNPDARLNPDARAESVDTEVRFRAVGPMNAPATTSRAHEPACAALSSSSGYFRGGAESDAYTALRAFENAQYFARDPNARAITIECTSFEQPCADARAALTRLRTEDVTIIRRVPCDNGSPECWEFNVQPAQEAAWTLTLKTLGRPARAVLRQVQPPVV